MRHPDLLGKRVLVVEDELLVAMLVEDMLADAGCVVVGPFARVAEAVIAAQTETVDGALLDVNVAGEKVFPVAYALAKRGVPFLLVTGYGDAALPAEHPEWEAHAKPFKAEHLANCLARKMRAT